MTNKIEGTVKGLSITYWLGSSIFGLVIAGPALVFLISSMLGGGLDVFSEVNVMTIAIMTTVNAVSMLAGTYLVSIYIKRKYIIRDAEKVVNTAAKLMLFIGGGLLVFSVVSTGEIDAGSFSFPINLTILYFMGKVLIKNTPQTEMSKEN